MSSNFGSAGVAPSNRCSGDAALSSGVCKGVQCLLAGMLETPLGKDRETNTCNLLFRAWLACGRRACDLGNTSPPRAVILQSKQEDEAVLYKY